MSKYFFLCDSGGYISSVLFMYPVVWVQAWVSLICFCLYLSRVDVCLASQCFKAKSSTLWLFLLQTDKLDPSRDTVFFRDGVRRIDFVLSYVDDKDGEKKQVSVTEKPNCHYLPTQRFKMLADNIIMQFLTGTGIHAVKRKWESTPFLWTYDICKWKPRLLIMWAILWAKIWSKAKMWNLYKTLCLLLIM